ncbi:hypothetical protein SS50377_23531 [Spironucleus salmonicida]|uniref:Uncharacterized protein n=1 Tax=Spironucleus salmonicida TaxID=348837 RepID=V6M586_9EUKA|nr:hypothetical protein SS50377_23531 [Spironucleus salmonicida]|eukprot:EST48514.1 Hypothetical protein SS50377_jh032 [Spironucleus salmonicida]
MNDIDDYMEVDVNLDQIPDMDSYERLEEALNFYQQPQIMIKIQGFSPFINNPQCFDDQRFSQELFDNTKEILETVSRASIIHTISNGFQQIADFISIKSVSQYTILFLDTLIKTINNAEKFGFTDDLCLSILAIITTIERFLQVLFLKPEVAYTQYEYYMNIGVQFYPLIFTLVKLFGEFSQELQNAISCTTEPSRHANLLIQLFIVCNDWLLQASNYPFTSSALIYKLMETPEISQEIVFSLTQDHPLSHCIVSIFSNLAFADWSEDFTLKIIKISSQSLISNVLKSEKLAEKIMNILWNFNLIETHIDLTISCAAMLGFSGFYENYELVTKMILHISNASQNVELSSVLAVCYDLFLSNIESFEENDLGVKIAVHLQDLNIRTRVIYRVLGSKFLCKFLTEKIAKRVYNYAAQSVIQLFKTNDLSLNNTFLSVVVNLKMSYKSILKNISLSDEARRIFAIKLNKGVEQCDLLMLSLIGEIGEGEIREGELLEETTQRLGLSGIYGFK